MSSNSKPIFVVRISTTDIKNIEIIQKQLDEKLHDYHVLVIPDTSISTFGEIKITFELYNPNSDITDFQLNKTKEFIKTTIKSYANNRN